MGTDNRWKSIIWGAWLLAAVLSLSLAAVALGGRPDRPALLAALLGGEAVAGAVLYGLVDRLVFRPAALWRRGLLEGEADPGRGVAGMLAPLADAVSERLGLEIREREQALRDSADKLGRLETMRRDLEETKGHLESKVSDLHSIYDVSTAVASTLDADELFRIIPQRIMETLGLKDFSILLYDPERRLLTCRAAAGAPQEAAAEFSVRPGEGVTGSVFESGEAVYIPDIRASSEFLHPGGRRPDVRSFMCVPMMSKGRVIGVLNVNHPEPNAFDAESVATMRVLATHLAIAVENAELFQFVKTLAEKDSLTLLYNHGAFHEKLHVELERAARYGRSLAVIMLDLDSFKDINDVHGHLVGDRILVLTAGVLCAHLRKSDIPARYGGDEFAVILPETDLEAAATIASRIAAGISQVRAETEKGVVVTFSVSIGYTSCGPASPNRENILDVADRLMYESKRRGRGGVLGEQL